jgi:hypothetical protein
MYIMASKPISTAHFINRSNPSVLLCVQPFIDARQRLGKYVLVATNARNSIRIVGRVILYEIRVLSKKSLCISLCIFLSLIGKKSVKTFTLQRRIVEDIVFSTIRVVSKERRRLVLPRNSCI